MIREEDPGSPTATAYKEPDAAQTAVELFNPKVKEIIGFDLVSAREKQGPGLNTMLSTPYFEAKQTNESSTKLSDGQFT